MVTDTGAEYWQQAIYEPASTLLNGVDDRNIKEGDPREPLKFKAFRGLPRLPLPPPALRMPASTAADHPFDTAALSTLLYHAYGVNRHDPEPGSWPYHRAVPSARSFHPTELYVVPAPGADRPAGVHYYDPMHHALVRLRGGDHLPSVAAAAGADLEHACAVVILSAQFWKNAFRYRDYAYRLCSQEAGMVAGNVLLTASALGLDGHVHLQFRDGALNGLLGLAEPDENALAVLALYRRGTRPGVRNLDPRDRTPTEPPPLSVVHVQPSAYDSAAVPALTRISRASLRTEAGPTGHLPPDDPEPNGPVRTVPPAVTTPPLDLAAALRARDSGARQLDFSPDAAPADVVWRIVREVGRPYPADILAPGARPPCDCYLLVRAVSGVAPGIYRASADGSALVPVRVGPVADDLRALFTYAGQPALLNVNVAHASLAVLLVVPREAAMDRFGARSFRILNQVAGIAAQRVCVMSAASGLTARVHNGYSARAAEEMLGLTGSGHTALFHILIGASRPDPTLRIPVVF
jgi:SagB-type dehydrogenase family enzyme